MDQTSIALDVVEEWLTDDSTGQYLEGLGVTIRIIQWCGPGGGNPYIEFFGSYDSLKRLFDEKFADGFAEGQFDEFIDGLPKGSSSSA